ncbi:hypothetical protein PM082_003435 [Marasmius tenuissimus]|nr:hypothetical protein PM082_003435 [Marasmius tenuissimus]
MGRKAEGVSSWSFARTMWVTGLEVEAGILSQLWALTSLSLALVEARLDIKDWRIWPSVSLLEFCASPAESGILRTN